MSNNLSQKIYLFSISGCLLFIILVGSVFWSSYAVELAFSRDKYAQQVNNQAHILKQHLVSDNIYDKGYDPSRWLDSQRKLVALLKSSPQLTPHQQTFQNSITSQNKNVKRLFEQITKNKLVNASEAIKQHLKSRLMTQLEAISSDSMQLSTIVQSDIQNTILNEAVFIVFVSATSILALLVGAFTLTNIFNKSLKEVKQAFEQNHSGHFQKIKLTYKSQEFESIVKAFNRMNDKLGETTVSLAVMKKVVEERTHVLEQLSNTDPLTKAANRRALFERAGLEFSRAVRNKSDLTLLLLDCDLFKGINDEFGHLVGDEFLVHICNICRQEIREIDFLARYGGEEFVVVLPDCNTGEGVEIASRIQRTLALHSIAIDGKEVCVTLSIGVCTLNENHKTLEELIHDTDKAMYHAKENGRNRIEILPPTNLH